jgi:predicted nucleotidyltransferase
VDLKGVAVPPREYFLGFANRFEQADSHDPDVVIYDVRKFCALAADCNPNIIEVLWADESDYRILAPAGRMLVDAREMFLSKKARHTFAGYAHAQLKRIKTHRSWLLSPPTHEPTREEFKLPPERKVSKSEMGAANKLLDDPEQMISSGVSRDVVELYVQERSYQQAKTHWEQYQNWKATRNEARAALEAKYGYDTKHGMHLVRLIRMCGEILTTGKVVVKRPDAQELLAIRAGEWSYDKLVDWAEAEDAAMESMYETSALPRSPDRARIDGLCVEIVDSMLKQGTNR